MQNFILEKGVASALTKCGNLNRAALRDRIHQIPKTPDVLVFVPGASYAAWALSQNESGTARPVEASALSGEDYDAIVDFWGSSAILTGKGLPAAETSVNAAAATLLKTPGLTLLPCSSAFPEPLFLSILTRAQALFAKDFPPITAVEESTFGHYVVIWDIATDTLLVKVWPLA